MRSTPTRAAGLVATGTALVLLVPAPAATAARPATDRGGAALRVAVGHAPSHFVPGMVNAEVTITVGNPGRARHTGAITVTDTLAPSLTATAAAGDGWACTLATTVTCTRSDRLARRAAYPPIRIIVNVAADAPERIANTAVVSARRPARGTDVIPARDACPNGWSPEQTVSFAPPFRPGRPGGVDSGVANPERADGCTLLDVIWDAGPFADHASFLATVRRAGADFVRLRLLSRWQRRAIDSAADRSAVATRKDAQIDDSCPRRVALTFDDGPSFYRPRLLAVLREKQVHATFFDNGVRVDANPQLAQFQVREGHVQLNHTYLHIHMDEVPDAVNRDEVLRTEAALAAAGAPQTFKGIRTPFGGSNPAVRRLMTQLGYAIFSSRVNTEDWLPERTAAQIRDAIVAQLRPGVIVGLHDGPIDTPAGAATAEAVGQIIDRARELGFCFGVVDRAGQVVADRYVPSGLPIPQVTNPVPYLLPLAFGAPAQLPEPWLRIPSPLQVTAAHTPAVFARGQRGNTLTLTVRNAGDQPTDRSTVQVVDAVPAGLRARAASGPGWTCTVAETVTCTRSDVLAPGAAYPPIRITVDVAAGAPPSLTNTGALTGHGRSWTDEAEDTINVTG